MDILNLIKQRDDKASAETVEPQASLSPICDYYTGKSILITGATGFIGKVLIEKLLYSCPGVKRIYLLIRSSKGKSPRDRMLEMIEQKPLNIRLKQSSILPKLVAIESDLALKELGLSPESKAQLVNDVSVIFHVAASVKFEAPLEVNMRHNVVATKELLEFACQFKQLLCFVHVSTAYSNCQLLHIDERVYPMPVPSDPMSLELTKQMIDNRPNTYTYTKALAENVAQRYADRINVVIVRPSIVMSSIKEPAEGWVDTINGPVGLSMLGALGILQKIKVNSEVVFDLIPVDIVSNALLSIGWATTECRKEFAVSSTRADDQNNNISNGRPKPDSKVCVFNLTTGSENPCSFYHYFNTGRQEACKKPSLRALRPLLHIPKQKGLFGQKKMVVKAVNRMHHANEMFDYFCSNEWNFKTDNVKQLRRLQTANDKETFNCDVRRIDWDSYSRSGWIGCRRFILKESDDTIAYAKKRYLVICCLYHLVKVLITVFSFYSASLIVGSQTVLWLLMLPVGGIIYLL